MKFFKVIIVFFLFTHSMSYGVNLIKCNKPIDVFDKIYSLEDHNEIYKSDDVFRLPKKQFNKGKIAYGFVDYPVWYKLEVDVAIPYKSEWYFDLDVATIDSGMLYVYYDSVLVKKHFFGDNIPFHKRVINYTNFAIPLVFEARSHYTICLKIISTNEVFAPISLIPKQRFQENKIPFYLIFGFFYGLLFVMFLYHFIIGVSLLDLNYIYYAIAMFFTMLFYMAYNGHVFQFVLCDYPQINNRITFLTLSLAAAFIILSAREFLELKRNFPIFYKIFTGLILFNILFVGYILFCNRINGVLMSVVLLIEAVTTLVTAIFAYQKGEVYARYFIVGWVLYMVSTTLSLSLSLGLLPYSIFIRYVVFLGTALEAVLLARALAHKYRLIQMEERKLQTRLLQYEKNYSKDLEEEVNKNVYKLELTNEKLRTTVGQVEQKNSELAFKNKLIVESIQYAKQIQEAILPKENVLIPLTEDYFILYRPKDIVSGDIYWFKQLDDTLIVATIDCTGHGVPGALLTMIAMNLLDNLIFEKDVDLIKVLECIDLYFKTSLETTNSDAMDLTIVKYDVTSRQLIVVGANTDIYLVDKEGINRVRSSRRNIGGVWKNNREFNRYKIEITSPTKLYLLSDGYQDQLGGEYHKKFMRKNLEQLLLKSSKFKMEQQKKALNSAFEDWKGEETQTDDVLIIGLELK